MGIFDWFKGSSKNSYIEKYENEKKRKQQKINSIQKTKQRSIEDLRNNNIKNFNSTGLKGANNQEQKQSNDISKLSSQLEDDLFDENGKIKSSISDKISKFNFTESQIERGCMYLCII